ncbi:MAG: BatA domain-containing protein [Planctomycetaceae bacterium]
MSLSFLYPLMWLGALSVAVPFWLHLRRRDETNLVAFSAMRFLDDQPLARSRPMWPRDWLLLLLRLLALLLLVASFAWPYQEDSAPIIIEESRVYILDNTLSHQADGAFAAARDSLADELAANDVRQQLAVIELTSLPQVVAGFADDATLAAQHVRELEPSYERGSFVDAFRAAGKLLQTSLGRKRSIELISDSQANQWSEGLQSQPFLKGIDVKLPSVDVVSRENIGLLDPLARRFTKNGRSMVECALRVVFRGNFGQVTIVFRSNRHEVARTDVTLTANTDAADTLNVHAVWESDPDQWLLGEVLIEGGPDVMSADDRVVFSLPPVRPGRIGLMADSIFLQRALSPEVMQGRFQSENTTGSGSDENPPDVLCVESHRLTSSLSRDQVRDALNAGRGVILLIDRASPLIAGFLRELGIAMQPETRRRGSAETFRYVFSEHPIFQPFRSADFGNLEEIRIKEYRRVQVAQAMPLAFSASGDPLIFEVTNTTGRLLVFAFSFDRTDTNWPIHPTFIPFLDKCLNHVREQVASQTSYEPGESVVWSVPRSVDTDQVILVPADTVKGVTDQGTLIRADVIDGQARFRLPARPGHYAVRYRESGDMESVLDVNPAAEESELSYEAEPQALALWQQPQDNTEFAAPSQETDLALSTLEILQQRIWWWLLLAALIALFIETVWVAFRTNPATEDLSRNRGAQT